MDASALTLALLDFAGIGMLPLAFFRRDGRLNLDWWLTAWPFFAGPALLIASAAHAFAPVDPHGWAGPLGAVSVAPFAASLALLFWTLSTHRIRIALWHQENDAPAALVTSGPYRLVRHPFYVSFLLALLGEVALLPHWSTGALLVYAVARLNSTAAREEKRLAHSAFGPEYRGYAARTGRFVPRPRFAPRSPATEG